MSSLPRPVFAIGLLAVIEQQLVGCAFSGMTASPATAQIELGNRHPRSKNATALALPCARRMAAHAVLQY
jgi:hypothetical protein